MVIVFYKTNLFMAQCDSICDIDILKYNKLVLLAFNGGPQRKAHSFETFLLQN